MGSTTQAYFVQTFKHRSSCENMSVQRQVSGAEARIEYDASIQARILGQTPGPSKVSTTTRPKKRQLDLQHIHIQYLYYIIIDYYCNTGILLITHSKT